MALTKGNQTVLDAWALTANGSIRKGTFLDISSAYSAKLFVKAALGEAVASTGQPQVIVQVCGVNADPAAMEQWSTYFRAIGPVGTPVVLAVGDTEPIGETQIACTNPATAGIDWPGKFKFIKHTTPANSEIIYQTNLALDAEDFITILDGLENEQTAAASIIVDIDSPTAEVVKQWTVMIDCIDLKGVRVIYDATYDPDGPDVYTSCQYILNTGV